MDVDSPAILREVRLRCDEFHVDLRLVHANRRWIAVAVTPDGPSMGWGPRWFNAAIMALQPFDGRIVELLRSAPSSLTIEDDRARRVDG